LRFLTGALLLGLFATPPAQCAASSSAADSPATESAFAILEFRVLHNTVLATRQVEGAVYPHLGPHKTFSDVLAARADLEKAYRDAGYSTVYVDVPEQSVENGVVRLAVTEGRVDRVRVTGTRYFSNRHILATVPSLQSGEVPHFPDVQADLSRLNSASTDLQVAPILKPGRLPGTVDAELKVKDDLPLHADVEVNDRYTADTTHTRLNVDLSYTNLFQKEQSLSFQYQVAPERPKDASVYALAYAAPIGAGGDSLSLFAVKTDSDVATFGTLGVLGKGHIYGIHYSMPLELLGSLRPSLAFGADYKNFDESILLSASPGLQTPIKYLNWSATFAAARAGSRSTTSFDLSANFGINGLVNTPAEFENKRFLAKSDYMYLRFDASQEQGLVLGTRLALRVSGQYAIEPIISNEQFALGGADSVRGYLEAEELGDMGASGSLELRTPSWAAPFGAPARQAYAYVFCDAGLVEIIDPLPQQPLREHLLSWGLGLRLAGYRGVDAGVDWAMPRVTTANTVAGRARANFRVRYGF
jgi:hemolysin activation/secretion protein